MSSFEEEVRKMVTNVACYEAQKKDLDSALDAVAAELARQVKRFDPTTLWVYGLEVFVVTASATATVEGGVVTQIPRALFAGKQALAVEVATVSEPSPAIKLALRSGMGLRLVG